MKQFSWSLFNIKTLQKQAKKYYLSPSKQSIYRQLLKGNYFQLMFRSHNNKTKFIAVEKLWCCFEKRENGLYYGRLVSLPKIINTLHFGDEIPFGVEHILASMTQEKAKAHFSMSLRHRNLAQLHKQLLVNSESSTQWIREMPANDQDTGWRLIGTNEVIANDAKDFKLFQLSKNISWDKILRGRVGARLENTSISTVGQRKTHSYE